MKHETTTDYVFRIRATEAEHSQISENLKEIKRNFEREFKQLDIEYFKKGLIRDCFSNGYKLEVEDIEKINEIKGVKVG